jgi:hypothetical protein
MMCRAARPLQDARRCQVISQDWARHLPTAVNVLHFACLYQPEVTSQRLGKPLAHSDC